MEARGPARLRLSELARAVDGSLEGPDVEVTGVAVDTRRLRPGELFVAVPGTRLNGAAFVGDALARGAAAVCVEVGADTAAARAHDVPVLFVRDARRALARLAAAAHGYPADALRLIGITGTLGKTSTALLVQAALAASEAGGAGIGVIGSLGARVRAPGGAARHLPALPDTGALTTPDAPTLHCALGVMRDAGVHTVAMEVTSHALAQGRVDGLGYALGIFTNLVPDEHLDFHGTEEDYLRTKLRFLDLLRPGAPLVLNADDPLVQARVRAAMAGRASPLLGVSLGEAAAAIYGTAPAPDDVAARVEELRWDEGGATFALRVVRPLPRLDAHGAATGAVAPCVVPVTLPVLGLQQVANAALAATAALVAGASPAGIAAGIADLEAIPRRMEASLDTRPRVVDDTTGNPVSLRAVFASIDAIPHRALRVLFGLRGMRGPEINRRLAATLGELVAARARAGAVTLIVTGSEDAAGPRDRVRPEERAAAVAALDASGVPYAFEPELEDAVRRVLAAADPDDLVLLLGAQGMDHAARFARETLRTAGAVPPPA